LSWGWEVTFLDLKGRARRQARVGSTEGLQLPARFICYGVFLAIGCYCMQGKARAILGRDSKMIMQMSGRMAITVCRVPGCRQGMASCKEKKEGDVLWVQEVAGHTEWCR
jgi:hypothetical protein